jgi:hypothetical protein
MRIKQVEEPKGYSQGRWRSGKRVKRASQERMLAAFPDCFQFVLPMATVARSVGAGRARLTQKVKVNFAGCVNAAPYVCLTQTTMGGCPPQRVSTTVPQENTMIRKHNVALPVVLLLSALALSACATKPQEAAVAEPAPAAVAAAPEATPAPAAVAEQPAPAVAAEQPVAEQPALKAVVKKAKRKPAKAAAPKPAPVEPVVAPAPVKEEPVAAPVPTPPAPVVQPAPKAPTKGFLEQYWLWLLGIVVVAGAVLWMRKKD